MGDNNKNILFSQKEIRSLDQKSDKAKLRDFFYDCLILNGKTKDYSQKVSENWSEKMTREDSIIN